jgi:ankyrin repeat protein
MTALDWAVAAGDNDVIRSLIYAGASVDRKSKWVRT